MTDKYLYVMFAYIVLMTAAYIIKSKRIKKELDKARKECLFLCRKLAKLKDFSLPTSKVDVPMFSEGYEIVTLLHQTDENELDERLRQLPADVLQMKQKDRAMHELMEELERIGAIQVFREGRRPETPVRRVDYELKVLVKK